jgi:hypothetical protein
MDRFTERTAREEIESLEPYTCWECGDACAELVQAPWTSQRLLVGACCLPVIEQAENEVSAEELAALEAEELALFGVTTPSQVARVARMQFLAETGCTPEEAAAYERQVA